MSALGTTPAPPPANRRRRPRLRAQFDANREAMRALGQQSRQVVVFAAVTGAITGLGVAGFEALTRTAIFDHLRRAPLGVEVTAPLVGLLLAACCLRYLGDRVSPATADEYIKNFHETGVPLDSSPVAARLAASVATLGLGGAMGYEGPSIYFGAAVGSALQRRFSRHFSREDAKVLLVAGAAAGVAAIFKAPVTGLVFALEVPYQNDLARRMLLPAGIAAAVSYVVFVALTGTAPLFVVAGSPPFDLRDLGGAALLGVLCGVGARLFAVLLVQAKTRLRAVHPLLRAAVGGAVLGALGLGSNAVFGSPLTLGAGYDNLAWALQPRRAVALVLVLFAFRALATIATVAGGGAGGLFIPLVIEGGLLGRAVGGLLRTTASTGTTFFPLVGVSAFLGAGYRVPLAAVVFAAEATGRPGFIVPGMIAATVAQLFMGTASASPYQAAARMGHLERRLELPVTAALETDTPTMSPDTTCADFFAHHLIGNRERVVSVVDGNRYLGVMGIDELQRAPRDQWDVVRVDACMRTDHPVVRPESPLRAALACLEHAHLNILPVVDDGLFLGVATTTGIVRLEEILGQNSDAE